MLRLLLEGTAPVAGTSPLDLGAGEDLRVLLVFAEAPGSRPLAMRQEREGLLALLGLGPPTSVGATDRQVPSPGRQPVAPPTTLREPAGPGLSTSLATDTGLAGTALALLGAGVAQVVAMRWAVGDNYARALAHRFCPTPATAAAQRSASPRPGRGRRPPPPGGPLLPPDRRLWRPAARARPQPVHRHGRVARPGPERSAPDPGAAPRRPRFDALRRFVAGYGLDPADLQRALVDLIAQAGRP